MASCMRLYPPGALFSEKLAQVNTSGHYTSRPITPARIATLDREAMVAFYRARFANAADFTLFMVGAFTLDEAIPLLSQLARPGSGGE